MANSLKNLFRRVINAPGWENREGQYPARSQWRQFFRALTQRERIILTSGLALLLIGSAIFGTRAFNSRTDIVPASGGSLTIGVVGRPLYINPILAPSNAADSDLERLTFAGLFRYDQDGNLVPDLATSYAIGDAGRVIEVTLRDDVVWPDGRAFSADDVAFTIEAVQDPTIRSPLLQSWTGVLVEVLEPTTIRFTLPAPYPPFLHNLTLGILPKHAWEEVPPQDFALAELNLQPIGLGPFRAAKFERARDGRILSYTLERNPAALRQPLLDEVTLRFFNQQQEALVAFNRGEVELLGPLEEPDIANIRSGHRVVTADLPRTFGVFFNQANSVVLADDDVRIALTHATDRSPILDILGGEQFAVELETPIPGSMFGTAEGAEHVTLYGHNIDEAQIVLERAEWLFPEPEEEAAEENEEDTEDTEENAEEAEEVATEPQVPIRENNDGDQLRFVLTHRDDGHSTAIATRLKEQWERIGGIVELRSLSVGAYRKAIIERDYEAILAGEELPLDPDLYAFWHSSQKFDPGGNLALFESPSVDAILEKGRENFDEAERAQLYRDAQKLLLEEAPAIFLWSGRYSLAADTDVRGIGFSLLANPSWRFGNVHEWYVRTKRVWRQD